MTTPTMRAAANPRISSPPSANSAVSTRRVRKRRHQGAGEGLIERPVHDFLSAPPAHPPEVLPNPVEHHDGVVERVSDNREHRREDREIELQSQHGKEAKRDQHIVHERGDGAEREAVFEPQPDVDENPEQRNEHGEPAILRQLIPHLGARRTPPGEG